MAVVVNPNKPMTMNDFARMYTGNGATVAENTNNIFFNAPTEAKSYMARQWNQLGQTGAPEDYFGRTAAPVATARNAEGFGVIAAPRNAQGYVVAADHPSVVNMPNSRGEIATLQNKATNLFSQAGVLNDTPGARVKQQIIRGGPEVLNVLREHTGSGYQDPRIREGVMDYSGIKPIDKGDELLTNKNFVRLATADPGKAAELYENLTGRAFTSDMELKRKQQLAVQTDMTEALRAGIAKGTIRRSPTSGMLQRQTEITDPRNPLSKTTVWQEMEPEMQAMDKPYWTQATGLPRVMNNFMDDIEPQHRATFLANFRKFQEEGLDERAALTQATQLVPAKGTIRNTQAAPVAATATPTTIAANATAPSSTIPSVAPTDPAAYQDWMTQGSQDWWASPGTIMPAVRAAGEAIPEMFTGAMTTVGRIGQNLLGGMGNTANTIAVGATGKPMMPWYRPEGDNARMPSGPQPLRPDPPVPSAERPATLSDVQYRALLQLMGGQAPAMVRTY